MTVRTRKTITDLIQQLKVQEKEIKSGLSDGQRRLNETRDRISTLYWVIEEIGDRPDEACENAGGEEISEKYEEISKEEWEELVLMHPHLSGGEIIDILYTQGFTAPDSYESCPCSDCSPISETKTKPKAKPLPKKKPTKKTKKGKK
jgi:hypothetical protein